MERFVRSSSKIGFAVASVLSSIALAGNQSFPGAEGYGGTFSGTMPANGWLSTANVYHVTTTADTTETTRSKRLAEAIQWMEEGKPRMWKYMKAYAKQ